jgi:orotidine-5'-phosphate decarboxylase
MEARDYGGSRGDSSLNLLAVTVLTRFDETDLCQMGYSCAGASVGDQKRIARPAEAIANGADYLVIGRQVTRSSDPRGEFLKICDEIAAKAE